MASTGQALSPQHVFSAVEITHMPRGYPYNQKLSGPGNLRGSSYLPVAGWHTTIVQTQVLICHHSGFQKISPLSLWVG